MRICYFATSNTWLKKLLILAVAALVVGLCLLIRAGLDAPVVNRYDPIYQGSSGDKHVSLICNIVWGEEYIPEMLQILRKQDVKITFFIGGEWADKNPELTGLIDREGHEIGNHGYAHLRPTRLSLDRNWEEIKKTEDALYKITGKKTNLFHPPYRELDNRVVQLAGEKGYSFVMSSIDTIDWQKPSPQTIVDRVSGKLHNGAIILMHPTDPTVKALPQMISEIHKKGYKVVPVSSLLQQVSPKVKEFPGR